MTKKVLFVFAGTGIDAKRVRDFTEGEKGKVGETFYDDVIRIYFNGCQDERIGGHYKLKGYLDPNLDVVATKLLHAFSRKGDVVTLSLADLKKEFANSIIIEPPDGLNDTEEIDDITLNGFSRGAVTAFACALALNTLAVPMSILAEAPVPGDDRAHTYKQNSLYAKNFDLSACQHIVRAEILLGTYSKYNKGWENKWFRQMAPLFDTGTKSHIFMVPQKMHIEFNRRLTTYSSGFLHNRGLTTVCLVWKEANDRAYLIPKVEQQKFHFGVVGRAEYLPSYKLSILQQLKHKYDHEHPCPIDADSKFKFGQALLALHNATMKDRTFRILSTAVLEDTKKAKGLREFIVEMDSIVQYSKEQGALNSEHLRQISALENDLYKIIATFYALENPGLKQQEEFAQTIQLRIKLIKGNLPTKVYNKLSTLTSDLLRENTLTHLHLVKFINENETFSANLLTSNQRVLDGVVSNAKELAQKLFHSSVRQRVVIFEQEKSSLSRFIKKATDLAQVAPFFTAAQIKNIIETVNPKINTMADILLIMKTLPSYEHRKNIYTAVKEKLSEMEPTFAELVNLMEYLSDKEAQELCKKLSTLTFSDPIILDDSMKQKLTENQIALLKKALPEEPVKKEIAKVLMLEKPNGDLAPIRLFQPISPESEELPVERLKSQKIK